MSRALIVDDKDDNLHYLRALLEGHGWVVDTARDGAEALSRARRAHPKLVISDLLMPVMDGFALLSDWRRDPTLRDVVFIVYTATYVDAEDERLALSLGADAFIVKPKEPAEFMACINGVLERSSAGNAPHPEAPSGEPGDLLRLYSQTLVRKLEHKSLQLVQTNSTLQRELAEQRRVELELQRSERELRQLSHELQVERARLVAAQRVGKIGSWETDVDTFEVIWSDETHRIHGTNPATSKLTHEGFLERVHPDDREAVNREFLASLQRSGDSHYEHRIVMPDGKIRFVEERWQVLRDIHGRPLRALGTCRDITESRLADAELRRSNELLRAVADSVPDAVFVKDFDGRYLLFNEGAARLVGRPVEEVLGCDDSSLFSKGDAELIRENDLQVLTTGQTRTTEEVLTAAGQTRTYLATKVPYRDGEGNVIGLLGISRDITARKHAEDKIHEQATLLDKARDAIVVRDLEGRVLYWNHSAERLYGWLSAEAIGRPVVELIYSDPTPYLGATALTLAQGEWSGELQQVNRKGRPLTVEGRWSLVRDESGLPKSIMAVNTDISERRRLEQHSLRSQRMESIGTLAGGIAHDLNNVLTPIMMSIELLKRDEQDQTRMDVLATIEGSARRGADLVRQVLSFARGIEGQRLEVPVGQLLREVGEIARKTFPKSISTRVVAPADLWTIDGDLTQLHLVLLNMCVNARDAMPSGGTLTLTALNQTVEEHDAKANPDSEPGRHVCIQVEDTGTGMSSEVLERIFEPFFTTKEFGAGTGLGLSTTLAIIKSHQGFVRVHSKVGQGTRFEVFLRASAQASVPMPIPEAPGLPRGKGETVLVIDDETAVRQITSQMLEAFGYCVLLAADGAEAVSIYGLQQRQIDLVLADMMMPVMDGHTTIKVLTRINPEVRIIAMSGLITQSGASPVGTAAELEGVKRFLDKPFTCEALLMAIRAVLDEPTVSS